MSVVSPRLMVTLAGVACLLGVFDANALQLEPGVEARAQYTTNAALEPDNEQGTWIGTGSLGLSLAEDTGFLKAKASSSLAYQKYADNAFNDQYYFNFNGTADWVVRPDRFIWRIANYYSQQPIQSLGADTPENRQDSNVFSTGPDIFLPISAHDRLILSPHYDRFYYEKSDADNQQFSLLTSWLRQRSQSRQLSLNLDVSRVDNDQDEVNPDFTIINYFLQVVLEHSRSTITVSGGATEIKRDKFGNESAPLANLAWRYELNRRSFLSAYLGTELTDTSTRLAQSEADPQQQAVSDQQISGDVIRANTAGLACDWGRDRVNLSLRAFWSDLDYKRSLNDQRTTGVWGSTNYRFARRWNGGMFGRYERQKQTDIGLRNVTYGFGVGLDYRLSRNLKASLLVETNQRDSNAASQEYDEYSGTVNLIYRFGQQEEVTWSSLGRY